MDYSKTMNATSAGPHEQVYHEASTNDTDISGIFVKQDCQSTDYQNAQ